MFWASLTQVDQKIPARIIPISLPDPCFSSTWILNKLSYLSSLPLASFFLEKFIPLLDGKAPLRVGAGDSELAIVI